MIFRNDFLEYFWDRHRAAEPFDNFSWAFLATNFNQEDHWFEGFPPPKNWAVLGVFWVKCCYYWSQQSWLPPVPFLQKIPYLDTMENHWTNVFFLFKKHPRNIHFFLHIWYGRIQFNDFPRWQHVHQQQTIDCGHNLLTWISLLKTAGLVSQDSRKKFQDLGVRGKVVKVVKVVKVMK